MKVSGILIVLLAILLFSVKLIIDKPLPKGVEGDKAEAIAKNMLAAINHKAWQKTGAVSWTYGGRHTIIWDKKRNYAKVSWGSKTALINCENGNGIAFIDGEPVIDDEKNKICEKAHFFWANDSYWLNPVSKIFDEGVTRILVEGKDLNGLLVSYSTGGFTPGDSYLWELDENGLPKAWYMWVSIIPINGFKATWEGWVKTETGVMISTRHKLGPMTVEISDLRTAKTLKTLTKGEDIFEMMLSDKAL